MMGWSDMPVVWGVLIAMLVPLQLLGLSESWLCGGIQFLGLAAWFFVGVRFIRNVRGRLWWFCAGYQMVIFITNMWVVFDELTR